MRGLEPLTSRLSGECSNQLSYIPALAKQIVTTNAPFDHSPTPLQPSQIAASHRKEVIQPHLPVQLPCYDFVPVTSPTFGGCLLLVNSPTSGVTSFHDVTGGVYKARERIQRGVADPRLLATPTSCRRVAAYNPN